MLCLCQGPHWQPWSGSSAFSAQGQPFLARCHEPEFQAKSGHPVFKSTHILLLQLPHVYTFLKASLSEGELLCSSMAYLIQGSATHKWLRLQLEWPSPKPDSCAELFLVWMDADESLHCSWLLFPQSCQVQRDNMGYLQPCPWEPEGFLCKDCLHRMGARRAQCSACLCVFLGGVDLVY